MGKIAARSHASQAASTSAIKRRLREMLYTAAAKISLIPRKTGENSTSITGKKRKCRPTSRSIRIKKRPIVAEQIEAARPPHLTRNSKAIQNGNVSSVATRAMTKRSRQTVERKKDIYLTNVYN